MNRIIRAFAAFIVSICLILAPAISYAASPNGWSASPADIIMNGATATINATKGAGSSALQSAIKHAPAAGKVGKHLIKGGGAAALAFAMVELADGAIDWVLDPANNSITYAAPSDPSLTSKYIYRYIKGRPACETFVSANREAVAAYAARCYGQYYFNDANLGYTSISETSSSDIVSVYVNGFPYNIYRRDNLNYDPAVPASEQKSIPINTVAAKVISNAEAGHAPSQEAVKAVAVEDVESGALDVPLNTAAVPKADAPAVPDPNAPPLDPDAPVPPFDPSSIISAIKSVMAAVVNMSGVLGAKIDALMVEIGLQNAETNRVINDSVDKVIANDNVNVGELVAAIEAIEGNTLDGQVINDAVDRVIANDDVKVGDIVAAIEAIEGNTLDGQVINDAVDKVIANDDVNAQSAADAAEVAEAARAADAQAAADAANTAAEAAKAADAANTAAVTDAIGAQTDAITEADPVTGEMSLKFPKFCSWALPVCTFTDWAMADPQLEDPDMTPPEIEDLDKYDSIDISKNYISATGQCPPAVDLNINFGVIQLSYEPLCLILEKLSGVIVAVAYISAGFMIVRTV